jgi:hypothetical protein
MGGKTKGTAHSQRFVSMRGAGGVRASDLLIEERLMSRNQYAFILGVLLVWVAADVGWVFLAAIAVGLIGLGVVRVLEGNVDLGDLTERFRSPPR